MSKKPLLKWPGGKRWLAPLLSDVFRCELRGTYYEPFAGAAAVFMALRPANAILSDSNPDLIAFLNTIRSDADEVVEAVWRFSNTSDCYYRVRSSQPRTEVTRAARFLYLNKACWGGVYRLNQDGQFNVPFGSSGRGLCSREVARAYALALEGCTAVVADFQDALAEVQKGDVVYCDPPYTVKGENNGFVRYNESLFSWSDQVRLAETCRRLRRKGVFVAVSGLYHDSLLELYKGWWALRIVRPSCVSRLRSGRKKVSEVVVFSRKPRLSIVMHNPELTRIE